VIAYIGSSTLKDCLLNKMYYVKRFPGEKGRREREERGEERKREEGGYVG
jgi:hypothetical protein